MDGAMLHDVSRGRGRWSACGGRLPLQPRSLCCPRCRDPRRHAPTRPHPSPPGQVGTGSSSKWGVFVNGVLSDGNLDLHRSARGQGGSVCIGGRHRSSAAASPPRCARADPCCCHPRRALAGPTLYTNISVGRGTNALESAGPESSGAPLVALAALAARPRLHSSAAGAAECFRVLHRNQRRPQQHLTAAPAAGPNALAGTTWWGIHRCDGLLPGPDPLPPLLVVECCRRRSCSHPPPPAAAATGRCRRRGRTRPRAPAASGQASFWWA